MTMTPLEAIAVSLAKTKVKLSSHAAMVTKTTNQRNNPVEAVSNCVTPDFNNAISSVLP